MDNSDLPPSSKRKPLKPGVDFGFKPGDPRPPGSGMQKGQKTKKVLARENKWADFLTEVQEASQKHVGKTVERIVEDMGFDPVVFSVKMAMWEHTPEAQREKYVANVTNRLYPSKKAEEIRQESVSTINIVIGTATPTATIDAEPSVQALPDVNPNDVVDLGMNLDPSQVETLDRGSQSE